MQGIGDSAAGDSRAFEDGDDSSRCMITGGKYQGHSGTVIAKNKRGGVRVRFASPVVVDGEMVEVTRGFIPQSNFEEF